MTGFSRTYSRTHPGKYGLMLDWETSGSDFNVDVTVTAQKYQGISYGAVVFDLTTFQPVETLYREIQFDEKFIWTDRAEEIHGLSREQLAKGVSREDALADLIRLLLKYWPPGFFNSIGEATTTKVLLAGHNMEFDRAFTGKLFADFDLHIAFHHVGLDTSQISMAMAGIYRSDEVFERFGGAVRGKHNALDDALIQLTVLRTMREIFDLGIETLGAIR